MLLGSEAAARRERQGRESFSRACDSSHSFRGFEALNPVKGPFGFSVKSCTRYILCYYIHRQCERFEPRSHFKSRLSLIVRVNVVLNRTVAVDSYWRFDNLCGSHLQRQSELYHVSWWCYTRVIDPIGQLRRYVIGRLSVKPWCNIRAILLQPYNLRVAHKPTTTLQRLLTNVKEKDKPEDRQGAKYTRSNAAIARLLTLVKPAETLARYWPNTNERWGMVTSAFTLLSTIYRRNINLTGTLRLCLHWTGPQMRFQ